MSEHTCPNCCIPYFGSNQVLACFAKSAWFSTSSSRPLAAAAAAPPCRAIHVAIMVSRANEMVSMEDAAFPP